MQRQLSDIDEVSTIKEENAWKIKQLKKVLRSRSMKTALCYSGQINGFREAIGTQQDSYYMSDMDIYAVFSNLISQRVNLNPKFPYSGKVHQYCPANIGWRKNEMLHGYNKNYNR